MSLLKKAAALFATSAVLACHSLAAISAPVNQTKSERTNSIYQKAKQELPGDWYALYRIIDRIARANNLDDKNWRIRILSSYQINAFATEVNLIGLFNGILDQLAGDSAAIACVVAHEISHHTERHIALTPVQILEEKKRIQAEAVAQVNEEIKSARGDMLGAKIGGAFVSILGGAIGGDAGYTVGSLGGSAANTASSSRAAVAQKRVQEIIAQKEQEFALSILETTRRHEFEADEGALKLIATAGFDPQGCLRVMAILKNMPTAEFDTTHPSIPKRIDRLKSLIAENQTEYLVLRGKKELFESFPLTYNLSKDRLSLRINSSRGGDTGADIDRLFGQ